MIARRGLTLVEVLVSTSLVMVILAASTTAFMHMRALTRRIEARERLHQTARTVFERLQWELSCLMQGAAFAVSSTAPTASSAGSVELVFMRGKLDELDYMLGANYGGFANALTDQVWSRWAWDGARRQLSVASSSPDRSFTLDADWKNGTYTYMGRAFRNLPTLQRAISSGSIAATLDADAYGTGGTGDIGDYQDLLPRALPIAAGCTDLELEVVARDGTTWRSGGDSTYLADGEYVDGRGTGGKRPRLVRVRFTLAEPGTTVSETFSFSMQAPALSAASGGGP